jgi:hypothetical protein
MAKIILIANTHQCKANYLETIELPLFSMQDFTVQGIGVNNFYKAFAIVETAGYKVVADSFAAKISLDDMAQMVDILKELHRNGLQPELTNIADTLYQA